jgi:hypothetical protein
MQNSDPLVWYGIALIVVLALFIIVPYLRGKSDLLTCWNVLLLGFIMFTAVGALEIKYGDWFWPTLQWFQPTRQVVQWYMVSSTVFLATLLGVYYLVPFGKAMAGRRLQKWPPLSVPMHLFVLAFCCGIVLVSLVGKDINFVAQISVNLSHKAAVFACVFAFMMWYRDRINLAWLALFIAVFLVTAMFSMLVFSGRRLLLSIFLGPALSVYWLTARNWRPAKSFFAMAVVGVLILGVSVVYSTFRWYSKGAAGQERTTSTMIEQMRELSSREGLFSAILANKLHYFSQSAGQYALLTTHYANTGRIEKVPLNTLRFLIAYPIPRRIWASKPQTIGVTLPRDIEGLKTTNWGVGIAGHAAYEGGIIAAILYAILVVVGIRFMDEPMLRQPGNPFLVSMHAAALPHVVAFARGDFAVMAMETIECFVFAVLLGFVCRMIFGTEREPTRGRPRVSPVNYRYALPGQPIGPRRANR